MGCLHLHDSAKVGKGYDHRILTVENFIRELLVTHGMYTEKYLHYSK